jgi:hypothetical protein
MIIVIVVVVVMILEKVREENTQEAFDFYAYLLLLLLFFSFFFWRHSPWWTLASSKLSSTVPDPAPYEYVSNSFRPCVLHLTRITLFMLGRLRCFHPVSNIRSSSTEHFYGMGLGAPRPTPNLEDQSIFFLSGSSPLTCLVWKALPVATLPPAFCTYW